MLRTADAVIEALRTRKEALGLSNAMLDEFAGLTDGHADKALGPSRVKVPSLFALMSLAGALGWAIAFVDDPDATVQRRWEKRRPNMAHGNGRISKAAVRKARPLILSEAARHAARSRWARMTPGAAASSQRDDEPCAQGKAA